MSSLLSESKKAENLALARDALEKAKSKATTNWKRWKPDWEQAARFYRDAVKYYKLSGDQYGTIQALRESAIAHKEIESYHTAAADLEAAAKLTEEVQHDSKGASDLYKEAAALYRAQGASHDKSAAMLVKAGECLGESDIGAAVEMMKDACAIFAEEGRAIFHDATFKKAICFCVNKEKFGTARTLLHRQIALQQQHLNPFESDIYKNILAIVVLRFHTGQPDEAISELQKLEGTERFARSEECLAANELVAAWEDGDEEKWDATLKKSCFKYLLHPVAVIARKMKLPEGAGQGQAGLQRHEDAGEEEQGGQVQAEGEDDGASAAAASSSKPKKARGKKIILDEEEEIDLR